VDTRSVAHPGTESTTDVRLERGRQLFEQRWNEIECIGEDAWCVPASHLLDDRCVVRLGDDPRCECRDFEHRRVFCKHQVAAAVAASKSSPCSCCGHRVLNRSLTEVTEDDELLGWFVGDMLCADCIRAGYWS
jgi:hypothetical protein